MNQHQRPFWSLTAAELPQQLQITPQGLASDEAKQRLKRYGVNLLKPKKKSDGLTLLLGHIFGFSPLPISFPLFMGLIAILYIITAEMAKKVFYKRVNF